VLAAWPGYARSAAAQDWSPFVLVTATLNLDTSVAFLTPVLVHTAASQRPADLPEPDATPGPGRVVAGSALLYGVLLLSNAGSLLLPGSNLTNLIVLGHLHLTGGQFVARMWLPWLAAGAATAAVAAIGVAAAGIRLAQRRVTFAQVREVLGVPVLIGLFGVAVALGAVGRAWAGPAQFISHLDGWATALVAGLSTVMLNNLPAASLLAARAPSHPFFLLVGLNLGPNLYVTGSLAWLLWLRAARASGARPSVGRASRLGLIAVPLALALAVGALTLTGAS